MSYTKNDWSDILPAAVKAKLDLAETGIKYVNDERDKESAPGRALVEAATVAAQRTALDVDSKAEVTAKANAAQSGAEGTAASALAGHVAASDPHTQYAKESDLGNAATKNVGTGSGDVAAGDDARLPTVSVKNLFNPNHRSIGYFVENGDGALTANASYDASEYIPVTAGVAYVINRCRTYALYNSSKVYLSGYNNSSMALASFTPTEAGYVRFCVYPEDVATTQIEVGTIPSDLVPYAIGEIGANALPSPNRRARYPVTFVKNTSALRIFSEIGGNRFEYRCEVQTTKNRVLNLLATYYAGVAANGISDTICPIRTPDQPLGANHGYVCAKITLVGHDKTTADIGSIWTDGTRQYTLVQITGNYLYFAYPYVVAGKNLFNPNARTAGYVVEFVNGALTANVAYDASEYVPITAGVAYVINKFRNYALYDASKTYISGYNNPSLNPCTFTPASSGFVRFSIYPEDASSTQIEIGTVPTEVVPFDGRISITATLPAATLTHVSGATHTSNVSVAIEADDQIFPSVNNRSISYILDGQTIVNDGTYYGSELQICDSYNIVSYRDMIDYIRANIGGTIDNDTIAGLARLSVLYCFKANGLLTIHHNIRALEKFDIYQSGFIQTETMGQTGYTGWKYIPNVKPISGYDFSSPIDITSWATELIYTPEYWLDVEIPPHRVIHWLKNTATGLRHIGYASGYIIDKTSSSHASRLVNTPDIAYRLAATCKDYFSAMDGVTLSIGDYYNFEAYIAYFAFGAVPNATDFYVVNDGKDTYVYVDYHATVSYDKIPLNNHMGKTITVLEKSDSCTVHNSIVDADGLTLSIATAGYAILKLS